MAIVTTDNRYYAEIASAIRKVNGLSELYTPAQMAAAILALGSSSRLPEGYTELLWIESTGTQYIDTEVSFSSANYNKVKLSVEMDAANKSGAYEVNGTGTSGSNCFYIGNYNGTVVYGHGTNDASTGKTHQTGRCKYTIDAKNGIVSADGMSDVSFTPRSPSGSVNLYVCGFGRTNGTATGFSGKFYAAQIWIDDVLARDFIPCINPSGEVGLYDKANTMFYGNAGTGSFVAGAIPRELPKGYTQVEYIQSSGTQYIDSGVRAKSGISVDVVWEFTDTSITTQGIVSARGAAEKRMYHVYINYAKWTHGYGALFTSGVAPSVGEKYEIKSDLSVGVQSLVVNGNTVYSRTDPADQGIDCNYFVFATNYPTGTPATRDFAYGKMYSCKMYDNGALIRDFVPCKNSGGVFGLYDMVNEQFYSNAGSGSLTGA